jgi:hypothetical protein
MNIKWLGSTSFWGIVLIVAGALFMLQTLIGFPGGDLFAVAALGIGSLLFLSAFVGNRAQWWPLIPGIILLGVAAGILVDMLLPETAVDLSGLIILGGIGVSFWAVYLAAPRQWWAIIPGGVMLTIGSMTAIDPLLDSRVDTGGIFFAGLGVTFVLVGLLARQYWAYIPALVLLIMAVLILAAAANLVNYIWPIALIAVGGYLLIRAFRR